MAESWTAKWWDQSQRTPSTKAWALVRFGSLEEATWVVANLGGNIPERLADPIVALDAWAVFCTVEHFS